MRIAYLLSQYPAVHHTFLLREVLELRKLGLEIVAISIRAPTDPIERMTTEERQEAARTRTVNTAPVSAKLAAHISALGRYPRGYLRGLIEAIRLGAGSPRSTLYHVAYFAQAVLAGRWMMELGCAHFHTHFSTTVGLLVTRVFPLTMSMSLHGPDEFRDPQAFHMTRKVQSAAWVRTISEYGRCQVLRSAPAEGGKIEVSRLGVDPALYQPRPHRDSPAPLEILTVGRLAAVKAHGVLVAAVARLVRDGMDVRLRLAGDGPERAMLEARIAALRLDSRVLLAGWQNQDRVREMYRNADVFALASWLEGIPVVLMEAMAMEIPCVATRITGVPELIRDGEDGLLVSPGDEGEMAAALAKLYHDPELRRRLGESSRRRVEAEYDQSHNAARLAEIFRRRLGAWDTQRKVSLEQI